MCSALVTFGGGTAMTKVSSRRRLGAGAVGAPGLPGLLPAAVDLVRCTSAPCR